MASDRGRLSAVDLRALACLSEGVDALVIQGKRLASAPVAGSEIAARTAVAAWLYHSGLALNLVCVEGEINRPVNPSGAIVAARLLRELYAVPAQAIFSRSWANCTRVEVRAIRVLARAHGWRRLGAITADYHAPRVRRLYSQVGLDVAVVVCSEESLGRLALSADPVRYAQWVVPALRAARLPLRKRITEEIKETILAALVDLDPRGVLERRLASVIRPWGVPAS